MSRATPVSLAAILFVCLGGSACAQIALGESAPSIAPAAATAAEPYEPRSGQQGKDVVWVPTPQVVVDKMMEIASVTAQDVVIDLGSGDGRTVITAAKIGARALGIEYNPDMVAYSQRQAVAAGLTGRARFMKADIFETNAPEMESLYREKVLLEVKSPLIAELIAQAVPRHKAGCGADCGRRQTRQQRGLEVARDAATGGHKGRKGGVIVGGTLEH